MKAALAGHVSNQPKEVLGATTTVLEEIQVSALKDVFLHCPESNEYSRRLAEFALKKTIFFPKLAEFPTEITESPLENTE
jgi:hypothetical protein